MSVFFCFLVIMILLILKIRFKCLNFFFVVIYYLFEYYVNESFMFFKRIFENVYIYIYVYKSIELLFLERWSIISVMVCVNKLSNF